jgi:hypothetical protein
MQPRSDLTYRDLSFQRIPLSEGKKAGFRRVLPREALPKIAAAN